MRAGGRSGRVPKRTVDQVEMVLQPRPDPRDRAGASLGVIGVLSEAMILC